MRNTLKNPIPKPALGTLSQAASHVSRISIWRTPVAAAALALSLGLSALDAQALALGKVNVLSALGEPLRAEIEVPDINVEEAASLKASIAGGDAFRAAGLEYNSALNGAQITLQRRPNGSSYLKLTSDRPVNEPFVDLILETTWATGRVVRDYTMLFDPSNARVQAAPSSNTAAGVAPSATAGTSAMTNPAVRSSASPATSAAPAGRTPAAPRPAAVRPAPAPAAAPVSLSAKPSSITVKTGNTATQIAVRYKPSGVSLDQMLVSMLSANPDAFVDGNINRLKKGAVLDLPTAETASATSEDQARQTITAQSKDFNEFRRRLAQGAPTATAPSASRKATGTVQAEVQDRKATAVTPDKLTLSKGAVGAAGVASSAKAAKDSGKEDAIAKEKAAKDAAARTAELSKNIQELNKLNAPTPTVAIAKPSAPATTASAAAGPAITVPAAVAPVTVAATPTAAAVATPTTVVTPTATVASATPPVTDTVVAAPVVDTPKPKPVIVAPPPPPEPSLVDSVLGSPYTPLAAGGLAAVLIGFGAYRFRQRKKGAQVDSSFLESRLQPDSFFGASGGQRVDTNDAPNSATGSSMVYSPSQLDAAGDVDPVAEADVYLAYGRDLQAEEILKEAMRTNPARVAIHVKLMEIYAKRRDTKAFESVANEAFAVTKGHGAEWETVSALGREIDPANPLYQHGGGANGAVSGLGALGAMGAVAAAGMSAAGMSAAGMSTSAFAGNTTPQSVQAQNAADPDVDFDLDLDFSSGDDLMDAPQFADPSHVTTSPIHVQQTSGIARQPSADPGVDLSFDAPMAMSAPDMDSFANGLNFDPAPPSASAAIPTAPMAIAAGAAEPAFEALEFDLGDLSLDLPGAATPAMANFASDEGLSGDPLETKLALALEFREIGDNDGARSLAQEVAQEASGALKARAQRMVADLS